MKKIEINTTNKNDIVSIFGEPSTRSTFDNDVWIYIERKITNTHIFGRRELVVNNVLVLEIDDLGLLAKIDFYDINDMNKIDFDKDETEVRYGKRSFVYDFLSSMRQKINDPLGVRKKRREEGQWFHYSAITAKSNKATILVIFIIGLTAGPAVSL